MLEREASGLLMSVIRTLHETDTGQVWHRGFQGYPLGYNRYYLDVIIFPNLSEEYFSLKGSHLGLYMGVWAEIFMSSIFLKFC